MSRTKIYSAIATFGLTGFFLFPSDAFAAYTRTSDVKVFDSKQWKVQKTWQAYEDEFVNGATIAVADVNGDNYDEIITASGPKRKPLVKIFTQKGFLLNEFPVFSEKFRKGLAVASGDIDGDGHAEIVVGSRMGAAPTIEVYNEDGEKQVQFLAFSKKFKGGVNIALGDVTGDEREEIIVASGPSGEPHVRVFNKEGKWIGIEFRPFEQTHLGGVAVSTFDIEGDGKEEIIMAMESAGQPWVKVYRADDERTVVSQFRAFSKNYRGGVMVAGGDFDDDGVGEIAVSSQKEHAPEVRLFEYNGARLSNTIKPYEKDFQGGVSLAAGEVDQDGKTELITIPGAKVAEGRTDLYKYIDVDLSEQRLTAYEAGYKARSFLISSGVKKYPSPEGEFKVWRKRGNVRMTWVYGPDNPDNYDLPDVPHVLSFDGAFALHGAYWHHNFGHVMSHGCINEPLDQAEWVYNFAEVGTPVIVHK